MYRLSKNLLLAIAVVAAPVSAQAFDRHTTNALKLCHDYLWFQVPEFKDLPNAAVSVFPGSTNKNSITVFWNVNWDDPVVQAAGNCTVAGEEVIGFEDYARK